MGEDGETKDDVKVPDGEVGEKIEKLFRTDEKDTSKRSDMRGRADPNSIRCHRSHRYGGRSCY